VSNSNDEAHQEGVRRRLLYIHEEMQISKGIANTKMIA